MCRADDGFVYWCKGWQAGVDALRKEWICANLAELLKLPIAGFAVLECRMELAQAWVDIDIKGAGSDRHELLARNDMKHVFGSKNLGTVNDMRNEKEIAGVEFENTKLRIALFDELIQNLDRSEGNSNILFMADSFQEFKIIDHGDALLKEFSRGDLMERHIFRRVYTEAGVEKRNGVREEFSALINRSKINEIWNAMPDDWKSDDWQGISQDEVTKVLTREWSE